MKQIKNVVLVLTLSLTVVLPFQNCSKVQMQDVDALAESGNNDGLEARTPDDEGGSPSPAPSPSPSPRPAPSPLPLPELPNPTPSPSPAPSPSPSPAPPVVLPAPSPNPAPAPAPGPAPSPTPAPAPVPNPNPPVGDSDDDWLDLNCNVDELRQSPLDLNFSASGGSANHSQLVRNSLVITDKKSVRVSQFLLDTLDITKSEKVDINQGGARKINIEALEITKLQNFAVGEMRVRANVISAPLHQFTSFSLRAPRILVQARTTHNVQQFGALCLRTNKTPKVHQAGVARLIGEGNDAHIGEIQQMLAVSVNYLAVDTISQVGVVVLRNSHVKKVSNVGRLVLINSTVDEISQVGKVIEED